MISGASSGIGAAIARELSSRGAHVVINYATASHRPAAERVQETLAAPSRSILVEADLSTTAGPRQLIARAVEAFGHLDILVNNAAVMPGSTPIDMDDEAELLWKWEQTTAVNCRGALLLTRASLPHLARTTTASSRIINISSSSTRDPDPHFCIYAGSKGMLEVFTRCWARDLPGKYGCTVNAVAPGPTATEAMLSAPAVVLDYVQEERVKRTPVAPRLGQPAEVAWTVAMLCEERAGWLNGLWIPVAGGLSLS